MNKHLIVIGIVILLLAVGLSGCFESNTIDVEIENNYTYGVGCTIYIDSVEWTHFTLWEDSSKSLSIDKTKLGDNESHTITLEIGSGGWTHTKSCYNIKNRVKFTVSWGGQLSCEGS